MPTPRYQTIATVSLNQSGADADSTPAIAELATTVDYAIFGQSPGTFTATTAVPTNTAIGAGGLVLATLNRTTWFVPITFRFRVVEKDTNPIQPDLAILDRRYDLGTWEDWADGAEHLISSTVQFYTVTLKYKVVKLQ